MTTIIQYVALEPDLPFSHSTTAGMTRRVMTARNAALRDATRSHGAPSPPRLIRQRARLSQKALSIFQLFITCKTSAVLHGVRIRINLRRVTTLASKTPLIRAPEQVRRRRTLHYGTHREKKEKNRGETAG